MVNWAVLHLEMESAFANQHTTVMPHEYGAKVPTVILKPGKITTYV